MLKLKKESALPSWADMMQEQPTGTLEEATARIKANIGSSQELMKNVAKTLAKKAVEIGRDLRLVKKHKAAHGEFLDYIRIQFDMNERTAQRYMKGARFIEANPDLIDEDLSLSAVHELAGMTCPDALEKVLVDIKQGKLPATGPAIKKAKAFAEKATSNVVSMKADPNADATVAAMCILLDHIPPKEFVQFEKLARKSGAAFFSALKKAAAQMLKEAA